MCFFVNEVAVFLYVKHVLMDRGICSICLRFTLNIFGPVCNFEYVSYVQKATDKESLSSTVTYTVKLVLRKVLSELYDVLLLLGVVILCSPETYDQRQTFTHPRATNFPSKIYRFDKNVIALT